MPWFPDFANAVELVRQQTRAAGRADPVGQYLAALDGGDPRALEDAWPGAVVVQDPRVGEVRGHRHLRDFVRRSKALLDGMHTRVEAVSSTVAGDRAVVELLAHVTSADGSQVDWPVAVVAERPGEESVVFRSYFSQLPVVGTHPVRPPILPAGTTHLDGIVGDYLTALAAGDIEATIKTFTPYGYLREPIGPESTHRGPDALRQYFQACFRDGGIGLEQCAVTDDGVRCAVEYNCVSWGGHEVPPQAGMVVHERDADGLLAAVRVYDDVTPVS